MLDFDEALRRVLALGAALPSEEVPLADAGGRVLTGEVRARTALPPHDYSAMDGYAVKESDLIGEPPFVLAVRGESRTGRKAPPLEAGAVCRIFTGAPLPEGSDCVVMQENVEREGDSARLLVRPVRGEHLRRRGEDLEENAIALREGTRLGPYQLGLVAAADRDRVRVARRPRVTILSTGDELRPPGSPPREASIPESNGIAIAALASAAGATVALAGRAGDDATDTAALIRRALEGSDVLVTIGGVSVGDYDVVRPALEAAGVALEFHKVAIKPGKPLTLGRRGSTVVLGLPGNPVSAQVTFLLFGVPLLRALQGDVAAAPRFRVVRLGAPIRHRPGRRGFYAVTVAGDVATPLPGQSSGSTTSLAHADALVVVSETASGAAAGETLPALWLDGS